MQFPLKTALALSTCVLALAAVHHWKPDKGLSPSIYAEAWTVHLHRNPPAGVQPLPAQVAPTAPADLKDPAAPRVHYASSAFLVDDSGALDPLFARLAQLKDGEHVAILHYGDSPTTADLITGDVRALLQQRFGDAGHGYLLVAKPWAWYGHRGVDLTGHGWTISTAVGKMRADTYGLGGASFVGSSGASSRISLKDADQSAMELSFMEQPNGGTVRVSADGQSIATVDTAAETRQPAWKRIPLPAGAKTVDIAAESGQVELFGETFERSQRGILYNSLGLNGASTTVMSRGFNPAIWSAELQHDAPALVIINYGTNESSFGSFVDKQYEGELRTAIQRIRNALPNVSILVMSPMDRGERGGIDEIHTMATIPRIVAIQKRVAADTHCAFFDTFDAMGGDGTMSRWYTSSPHLVSADLIHPTPQGASIIAQIFVKNLMQEYDSYTAHQPGITQDTTQQAKPEQKQVSQP
ncbi:GDSL-type esterase/lipase family protein [Granulicella arctica]|uniref:Lysophospholipase L1-like esterase n=1 Tax=Granulicella arctica TaxID=940613 RepID=A0A7Y9PEQ6_9BACT|nr:GDSL-type esterase/lipase family protein [Granulicella arctica]NYF78329.1 lysophospholipase L1-like esterase [Granulicella arctica]